MQPSSLFLKTSYMAAASESGTGWVTRSSVPSGSVGSSTSGISATSNVLGGLLGVVALVLGLIAISRRGLSKTLAAAGIALGAAALVGVFGTVLYTVVVAALYG